MFFFSATINNWRKLLLNNDLKEVIINSFKWLNDEKKVNIHGFVIMPNHIHVLWTNSENEEIKNIEIAFLKFTAHEFKKYISNNEPNILTNYISSQNDRAFQFWERRPKSIKINNKIIAEQKLNYIHHNPLQEKWKLVEFPKDYFYSSALFYENSDNRFGFLTHYNEYI